MPPDNLDDQTRVTCGRCDGEGVLTERLETRVGYRITNDGDCWLCKGLGVITVQEFGSWVIAGRPLDKPPGW